MSNKIFANNQTADYVVSVDSSGSPVYTDDMVAAIGTTIDAPTAYDGADEDSTAKTGISLWKRMCNALKAIAAPLVASYNSSNTSLDVTETSSPLLMTIDADTPYMDAVTGNTTGSILNRKIYNSRTFWFNCSAYTSGTITVKAYKNGINSTTGAELVDSYDFTATGSKSISVSGDAPYVYAVADFTTGTGVGTVTAYETAKV